MLRLFRDQNLLISLAWINVILHVIGLVMVVLWMRPGTPLIPLAERQHYLATSPLGWQIGWGCWMLCTLALIAFCAAVAATLPKDRALGQLAVIFATAGGAIDISCDALNIKLLPLIASWGASATPLFITIERITSAGGLIVGNGFYTIAILLLTIALREQRLRYVVPLGIAVFISGMLMVAAGFTAVPEHLEVTTGPTIGSFSLWVLVVAYQANKQPAYAGSHD